LPSNQVRRLRVEKHRATGEPGAYLPDKAALLGGSGRSPRLGATL
jgi:hypothetical protein